MKIIFIGGVFREDIREEIIIKSKTMPFFQADTHQWAIIKGLDYFCNTPIKIINAVHLGSYPKHYKDIYIKPARWSHNGVSEDLDLGFLNIFFIKHIWRAFALIKNVTKEIKTEKEDIIILTYGLHVPFLISAYFAKKARHKKIKWCSIIPEIPVHYIGYKGKTYIYNVLKTIDWYITKKLLMKADMFELLTEQMADLLKLKNKKYIVVEGIIKKDDASEISELNDLNDEKKLILYTGTTDIEYGIINLLNSFAFIEKDNYRLIIYGNGNADKIIKDYMKKDTRIIWNGFTSRENILKIQRKATVLINPRSAKEEFTKYSFPSKTMEYLLSGTPVIMNRLLGIPYEYEPYITWFENEDPENMANKIIEICEWSKEKRLKFGDEAKKFVLEFKNEISQGKLLYEMLLENK